MDFEDLKLCYLFTKLDDNICKEKETMLEHVKNNMRLNSYYQNEFNNLKKEITSKTVAEKELLQMLPKKKANKKNKTSTPMVGLGEVIQDMLHPTYESMLKNSPERSREILFTLLELNYADKNSSPANIEFIYDFAERMNINESYIHEFSDIISTSSMLNSTESSDDIKKIIDLKKDLEVLKTDVSDLINLG